MVKKSRELPSLAQMTVNRLLYVDQEIPKAVVQSWVVGREKEKEATEALSGLGVWQECSSQGGVAAWRVNDMFKKNLKIALLGG